MAAGGTGGHLLPALAVARSLRQQDPTCTCLAVSGARGGARQLWDQAAGELATVPVEPWPQGMERLDPRYWWRQARAASRMLRVLRRFRPDVVVGFGGYVAGPAVLLATWRGTATVIHEQNVFPGRTTRLLASWADRVAVSFDETRQHLPAATPVTVTGNPVRAEVEGCPRAEALAALALSPARPVLLVMGGSQGSHTINTVMVEALGGLPESRRRALQVLHLTGGRDAPAVTARYQALGVRGRVQAYLPAMGMAYAAATLAVARAGATTVAELVATATPAVLVPYPHAGAHQTANASWLARHGGAIVMDEAALDPARVRGTILPLLTDADRLHGMRSALRRLVVPGAAQRVAETVVEAARAA